MNNISNIEREKIARHVINHHFVRMDPMILIGGKSEAVWSIFCTYDSKKYCLPIGSGIEVDDSKEFVLTVEEVKVAIFKLIDEIVADVE